MKKSDVKLIIFIVVIAVVIFGLAQSYFKKGDYVTVVLNGKTLGTYALSESFEIELNGTGEASNQLQIKEGKALIKKANCPDKLCVYQKAIYKNGESLICLPHKLVITVTAKEEAEVDAVAN